MEGVVKYANDAMASGHRGVGDILRIGESRGARHQRISRVCVETYRMVSHRWLAILKSSFTFPRKRLMIRQGSSIEPGAG